MADGSSMDYIIPGLKSYINVVPKQFRQEIVIRLLKAVDIGYITGRMLKAHSGLH